MYVASWYFDQFFFKKSLTFSWYCLMCMFICYNPHYSFGGTSKIFDQHRWWSLSSLLIMWWRRFNSKFNSQLTFVVQFLQSHIMIKKYVIAVSLSFCHTSKCIFISEKSFSAKNKDLEDFFENWNVCRRQSYGILLFNNHLLKSSILNPGAELRLFSLTLYYITKSYEEFDLTERYV